MKGIFKNLKGRFRNRKGGSLITVMTTMAILSIVALCAASIALTNYRTTKTYNSQDEYYYAGETGQKQFVAHINDVAYNYASSKDAWTEDDITELYNTIADVEFNLGDTTYNGEYTVTNEIVELETNSDGKYNRDDNGNAVFTIITTVTDKDGSTQQYTSEIKIQNPLGETDTEDGSMNANLKFVNNTDNEAVQSLFNTGFAVVTESSASNTSWYGLWGNFNTYTTAKVKKTSPYNSSTKSVNQSNGVAQLLTVTDVSSSSTDTSTGTSALYLAMAVKSGAESTPKKNNLFFATTGSHLATDEAKRLHTSFFDDVEGFDIDVVKAINLYSTGANVSGTDAGSANKITLKYGERNYMDSEGNGQRYYAKYNGDFTIGFNYTPADDVADNGGVLLSSVQSWNESTSAYRVVFTKSGKFNIFSSSTKIEHQIAYKYTTNGRTTSYGTSGARTYPDHYYSNKWFFIDLGGTGTLYLENSTSTTKTREVDNDYEWHRWFFWIPILQSHRTITDYACTDAYDNYNYPSLGNIIMEDCYFFVNGNISIANAYNLSNCKVFATGDILLEKVYYLEGLLSLETDAGSPTIEQSLYYCEGMFVSELVSRYAMNWTLNFSGYNKNTYYKLSDSRVHSKNDELTGSTFGECMIQNGCTYGVASGFLGTTEGYLATFRYPTVLKATIIAMGEGTFKPDSAESDKPDAVIGNNSKSSSKEYNDVSVVLNPDGSTYGVVDCVLIEGQIFSQGRIYCTNYNYMNATTARFGMYSVNVSATNRYSASSQIQFKKYNPAGEVDDKNITIDKVFELLEVEIVNGSSSTSYNPITVVNGGIYKK